MIATPAVAWGTKTLSSPSPSPDRNCAQASVRSYTRARPPVRTLIVSLCISTLSVGGFWDSGPVQIAILGPLVVRNGVTPVDVAGSRLRRLLIRLALDAGRP